ncbi:MAG: hypothetical protein HNEKOMLI_00098 [Sodalis sp. Psp]|nr:hypothetical protein [Sodalis sp. Psp]
MFPTGCAVHFVPSCVLVQKFFQPNNCAGQQHIVRTTGGMIGLDTAACASGILHREEIKAMIYFIISSFLTNNYEL